MAKKPKATKSPVKVSNVRAFPSPPAAFKGKAANATVPAELKLSDEQMNELRAMDQNIAKLKNELGHTTMQSRINEARLINALIEAQKAIEEKAKAHGASLGIDLDKERWSLDFQTGLFTKS